MASLDRVVRIQQREYSKGSAPGFGNSFSTRTLRYDLKAWAVRRDVGSQIVETGAFGGVSGTFLEVLGTEYTMRYAEALDLLVIRNSTFFETLLFDRHRSWAITAAATNDRGGFMSISAVSIEGFIRSSQQEPQEVPVDARQYDADDESTFWLR